jgi:ABC-type nitrate/sulfonate/bicarbonate transport system substrate-binding protein
MIFRNLSTVMSCIFIFACDNTAPPDTAKLEPITIASATKDGVVPWGMVNEVFERTNVLEKNGLRGSFVHCDDSPDLLWTMIHGDVDVGLITTGVMGSLTVAGRPYELISTSGAGGRIALMVPTDSPAQSIKDLKGARIENPILGGLLERFLSFEGLGPDDVQAIGAYRYDGSAEADMLAGKTDAIMHWDPYVERLVASGKARILVSDPYHLEIMMAASSIATRPKLGVQFLVAQREAVRFMLDHTEMVAGWYAETSGVPAADALAALPYSDIYTEGFGKDIAAVHVSPTEHHVNDLKGVVGAMGQFGVLRTIRAKVQKRGVPGLEPIESDNIDISTYINWDLPRAADAALDPNSYDPKSVKVTNPKGGVPKLRCRVKKKRRRGPRGVK